MICGIYTHSHNTSIIILIDSFPIANVIVGVRDEMYIEWLTVDHRIEQ